MDNIISGKINQSYIIYFKHKLIIFYALYKARLLHYFYLKMTCNVKMITPFTSVYIIF